jgi:hypothetical protein
LGHSERIIELVAELRKHDRVAKRAWLFSFIPPWKVLGLLEMCDLVAFLEHGFEIEFHAPQVPREVFACGPALLC